MITKEYNDTTREYERISPCPCIVGYKLDSLGELHYITVDASIRN